MVKSVLKICKTACASGLLVLPNFSRTTHKINNVINIDLTQAGSCLTKN